MGEKLFMTRRWGMWVREVLAIKLGNWGQKVNIAFCSVFWQVHVVCAAVNRGAEPPVSQKYSESSKCRRKTHTIQILKAVCSASKLILSLGPDLAPGLHRTQFLISRVCFALKTMIPILKNRNKMKKALNGTQLPYAALKYPLADECSKAAKWISSWTGDRAWSQAVMHWVHPQQSDSCQTALYECWVHGSLEILLSGRAEGQHFLVLCFLKWTAILLKHKQQDGGQDM